MKKAQKRMSTETRSTTSIGEILMAKNPELAGKMVVPPPKPITLVRQVEFDSLLPEQKLDEFISFLRQVITTYDADEKTWQESDDETQDLLHYMELSENMNAANGYDLYKRMTEVRRERRRCRNEMDLLKPLYDELKATNVISTLCQIKGKLHSSKEIINNRSYTTKTEVIQRGKQAQDAGIDR